MAVPAGARLLHCLTGMLTGKLPAPLHCPAAAHGWRPVRPLRLVPAAVTSRPASKSTGDVSAPDWCSATSLRLAAVLIPPRPLRSPLSGAAATRAPTYAGSTTIGARARMIACHGLAMRGPAAPLVGAGGGVHLQQTNPQQRYAGHTRSPAVTVILPSMLPDRAQPICSDHSGLAC